MENHERKKIIILPTKKEKNEKPEKNEKIIIEKEKSKRIITNEWKIREDDLLYENQINRLQELYENKISEKDLTYTNVHTCIIQQLNKKIYGYKAQDLLKKLFDEEHFVDLDTVIHLLYECKLNCYYCKKNVKLLYEFVREPMQWSIERLDNNFGHNKGNIVIACLSCNLKRKTMYHERFLFTKQMSIVKSETSL